MFSVTRLRRLTIAEAAAQASKGTDEQLEKHGINRFKDRINDVKEMYTFRQNQKKEKGERFGKAYYTWWQWLVQHSYLFLGLSIIFTNYVYYGERGRREEYMCNIEENRRRFYGKLFRDNEYMPYTPTKLYDGPAGYIQVDPATGIKTNTDGKMVAPDTDTLRKNIAKTTITDDMVKEIAALKQDSYAPDVINHPHPEHRKKQFTGFM